MLIAFGMLEQSPTAQNRDADVDDIPIYKIQEGITVCLETPEGMLKNVENVAKIIAPPWDHVKRSWFRTVGHEDCVWGVTVRAHLTYISLSPSCPTSERSNISKPSVHPACLEPAPLSGTSCTLQWELQAHEVWRYYNSNV